MIKRLAVLSSLAAVASLALTSCAGADTFNADNVLAWGASSVTLTIPTPPCPVDQPGCTWTLFVQEPKTDTTIAAPEATSGVLKVDYPPNFCGVLQADAKINGASVRGFQHTVENCTPDSTTTTSTTTAPPDSTTTTGPSPTTTAPNSQPTDCSQGGFAGCSGGGANGGAGPSNGSSAPVSPPQALASTGADYGLLAAVGTGLVALGVLAARRRRRA